MRLNKDIKKFLQMTKKIKFRLIKLLKINKNNKINNHNKANNKIKSKIKKN